MLSVKGPEGSRSESGGFSAEIQAAVRAELEMMLKAPFFAQSHRCKGFLSYVVMETLSGNASDLKERTIGISVFGRANDYDTGETSIVRVTANEVRKRIGQYYRESQLAHPIQIELPKGAYVPEFRIQPSKRSKISEDNASLDSLYRGPTETEFQTALQIPLPLIQGSVTTVVNQSSLASIKSPQEQRSRKWYIYLAFVVLVLCAGTAVFGVWKIGKRKAGPEVWEAFSHSKAPILICIDTHDLHLPAAS